MKDLVVFCSGWGSPSGIEWKVSPIYQKLRESGFETKIWRNCNNGITDIVHNAACLTQYLYYHEYNGIYIIGHSMGGLIAHLTAQKIPIKGVITLATPHLGVPMARLAAPWSKSAQQMVPGNDLLTNLNLFSITPNLYSIACKYDGIVRPIKNSISPMSTRVDLVGCSHLTVLLSWGVANKVCDFIGGIK